MFRTRHPLRIKWPKCQHVVVGDGNIEAFRLPYVILLFGSYEIKDCVNAYCLKSNVTQMRLTVVLSVSG